jgi:hypothetical protein
MDFFIHHRSGRIDYWRHLGCCMFAFDMAQSRKKIERMTMWPNQSAAANGLSAVRWSVAGIRERMVRSTAAAEAAAELDR